MSTASRVSEPQQERSRESLERVMEAGMQILIEDGWDRLTLARVCERAGVSVGMLYRRFHGRGELLAALRDRWIDSAARSADEVTGRDTDWAALGALEALRVVIKEYVDVMRISEGATHVLGLNALDDDGFRRLAEVSRSLAAWFHRAMAPFETQIQQPDPRRAVDFAFRVVFDTTIRRTTHGDEFDTGTTIGDWDAFADELWRVCRVYLFAPDPV